jgi:hypothetical protein
MVKTIALFVLLVDLQLHNVFVRRENMKISCCSVLVKYFNLLIQIVILYVLPALRTKEIVYHVLT